MGSMFNIFRRQPTVPDPVPTDRIIPIHYFDNTLIFTTFVMSTMFVFDDVLDAQKLHSCLERLVERDGWGKLGARLRKNSQGELEYHIPAEFSRERPAVGYTHVEHDMAVEDHPTACRLPKSRPMDRPAVVGNPDDFVELVRGPDAPTKLDDYLYTDRPQLGLHVVSFKNSTLVCLHWLHATFDTMAKKALVDSWTLMLQGRDDEVPRPFGSDRDPLSELGKHPSEPHKLAGQQMSMPGLLLYVASNAYDLAIRGKENRVICIPDSFLKGLRAKALKELDAETQSSGGKKPFLSEGDVLVAWFTRLNISHLPPDSNRTVTLQNAYSLRKVLAKDGLMPEGSPYISNCVGFLDAVFSAKDIFQKPLSYVASQVRCAIKEQGTRAQVESYSAMVRESSNRLPPMFGDSSMHLISYSNWCQADLFGIDFSSAAVSVARRETRLGPSYIQPLQFPYNFNEGFLMVGKDTLGNYWMSGYRSKGNWAKIEKELARVEDHCY